MLITNIIEALCLKAKNLTSSECPEKDEVVAAILAVMAYLEPDVIREHLKWKTVEKGTVMSDKTLINELYTVFIRKACYLRTAIQGEMAPDRYSINADYEAIYAANIRELRTFELVLEYLVPGSCGFVVEAVEADLARL